MDSGLRVRWPLSPYTTALAAGALFALCVVFYKHRSNTRKETKSDPRGQASDKVDPNEKKDESRKNAKEKDEEEKKRTKFPVLTFRELNPRFNSESITLRSPFRHLGAIPRRVQRSRTLEDSQLFTALRRRTNEKGNKSWQGLSRGPSNFSCIYQQSFSFGSEAAPSVNARFELNVSPYLHQYFREFNKLQDIQLPDFSSKSDFKNCDVLINPEILKDKPLTRSALSLTLESQLHKILSDERVCERNLSERSVRATSIIEGNCENNHISGTKNKTIQILNIDSNGAIVELPEQDCDEHNKTIDDSSLWDSGYCDKSFDERYNTTKELNHLENSELSAISESTQRVYLKAISQDSSEEKSSDQSLSATSEESNETVKFISAKSSLVEHDQDDDFCSSISESNNFEDNPGTNDDDDVNCLNFEENSSETSEPSLENNECKENFQDTRLAILNSDEKPAELNFETKQSNDVFAENRALKLNYGDNLNADTHLEEKTTKLSLENYAFGNVSGDSRELNSEENFNKSTKLAFENNETGKIHNGIQIENLNSEENSSSVRELSAKNDGSDEICNEIRGANLNFEADLNKPPAIFLEKTTPNEIRKEVNTINLKPENAFQLSNVDESQIESNLNIIKNDFDDKCSESENEVDDILKLYTNILEDFNGSEIKVAQEENASKHDKCPVSNESLIRNVNALQSWDKSDSSVKINLKSSDFCHDSETGKKLSEFPAFDIDIKITGEKQTLSNFQSGFQNPRLERFQVTFDASDPTHKPECKNLFSNSKNISVEGKIPSGRTRVSGVDAKDMAQERSIKCSEKNLENTDLERIQKTSNCGGEENNIVQSAAILESEQRSEKQSSRHRENAVPDRDVIEEKQSCDLLEHDEERAPCSPRQMDRETSERSVAVESTVTTETTLRTNGDAHLSTALVSRLTLDDWSKGSVEKDSVSVRTTINEEIYRPTFEEFVPLKSSEKILSKSELPRSGSLDQFISIETKNESNGKSHELPEKELLSSPRVDRLKGLLNRDEERRARSKFHHLADSGHVGGAMEGEWDRLLRDVLASVSELERWERRHCDVSTDAEDAEQQHHFSQSDSSFTMEEETLSPSKGETPTKVKSLRFKLDPDVFDVPSDDSFYDDDDDDSRRVWRKQSKYRAFSSLELKDEPVRLVSVHASVVPAGQKMVARPVGIDLRVRLTEERQSKRAHVSTSPSQAKRRSPVSDRGVGWCQELSPVTENVDWREAFTPVASEPKSVPNGILKTPSPKIEPTPTESPNPFKLENGVTTNGISPVSETKPVDKPKYNGLPWKPNERKPFSLPRKKFEPDPEAIERITGYKIALSKPPLPPPPFNRAHANFHLKNKADQARKQYLDSKAALAASKVDGTKKFQQFLNQAQNDRARIVTSVPDLAAIERAVTEQWIKERGSVSPRESPSREDVQKSDDVAPSRGSTPDDAWSSYVQSCRQHLGRRSQSMTYLETDIDIIPILDEDIKCHSISALDEPDEALPDPDDSDIDGSREDLDDSGRAKSEHELRIERSLRSLPVPEWYKQSDKTKTGFLLGNSAKEKRGWAAAKSLASSTSSLASCGLKRPVRSLRSSRENIPWSRSSASPDGPTLSLALAKAFREPYLGWRARTPTSSGVSSSPRASPPSWGATTTDDEANGVSFDGEDAFGRTISSEDDKRDEPLSLDDTGADAVTVSMDTNDPVKLPGGEDTCDDINNMSMDTCELFDASVVVPVDEDPSPQADTGDDIDNLSTDTTTNESRKLDPKLKRYSYSQSIYHSEWDEEEESRGDHKGKVEDRDPSPSSSDHKVVWIESSFVGSRTTTSIMVLPQKNSPESIQTQERPASR